MLAANAAAALAAHSMCHLAHCCMALAQPLFLALQLLARLKKLLRRRQDLNHMQFEKLHWRPHCRPWPAQPLAGKSRCAAVAPPPGRALADQSSLPAADFVSC